MKTIGLLGLSNPVRPKRYLPTYTWLKSLGFEVEVAPTLTQKCTPQQRATVFNEWMAREDMSYIFDVSGGDLAIQTLPYLDFEGYQKSQAIFHGYSDVSLVLNVLAQYRPCILFQIAGNIRKAETKAYLAGYKEGLVVGHGLGGNIRALLKLAGTPYFPRLDQQPLFIESRMGDVFRLISYLEQLNMMGQWDKIDRLVVGQCTQLESEGQLDLFKKHIETLGKPVLYEHRVGHSFDSLAWEIAYD